MVDDATMQYYAVLLQSLPVTPRLPNLIGVGASRCGTGTLQGLLAHANDVYVSPVKEVNFFGVFQSPFHPRGWSLTDYARLFLPGRAQRYASEISPVYLTHPRSAEAIHDAIPFAKIVVTLRDPLDRFQSLFKYHAHFSNYEDFAQYTEVALTQLREGVNVDTDWYAPGKNLAQSLYARAIEEYIHLFGRDNVLVLYYEDLVQSIDVWCSALTTFLDVEVPALETDTEFYRNPSHARDTTLSTYVAEQLFALFRKDVRHLEAILGTDLAGMWPSCR